MSAALSAVTAAVVGVVLNLAIWFAVHVLFREVHAQQFSLGVVQVHSLWPEWSTISWGGLVCLAIASALIFGLKQNLFVALAVSVAVGVVWYGMLGAW
jgi:hypothetical protein